MSYEIRRARGRTTVFAGSKQSSCDHVQKLETLCIQKLLNNVGRIEHVGDVPYYILKPLLLQLPLDQLRRIESFNPKLIADPDSDEPWQNHCAETFEGRKLENGETWRELFARCSRERDRRLAKITKKIKKNEKKASNVRQARVVEHVIATKPSLSRTGVRAASTSGLSNTSISSSAAAQKQKSKTAPLMQKSMLLFKSRHRR